jgi:capsular polysaccharide biosynthesis protein/Tfp pilus assembly protein PilF
MGIAFSLLQRAMNLHREGLLAEAEMIYLAAERLSTADELFAATDSDIHVLLAMICQEQRRIDDALRWLMLSHRRRPTADDVLHMIAFLVRALGNVSGEEQVLKRQLCLDPGIADHYVRLAELSQQQRKWDQAEGLILQAELLAPSNAAVLYRVGRMLADAGENFRALQYLIVAVSLDSENSTYQQTLAEMMAKEGRITEAESLFRLLLNSDEYSELATIGLARLLKDDDRKEESRNILICLAENSDLSQKTLKTLSSLFFELGETAESIRCERRLSAKVTDADMSIHPAAIESAERVCRQKSYHYQENIEEISVSIQSTDGIIFRYELPPVYLATVTGATIITSNWTVLCPGNQLIVDGLSANSRSALHMVSGFLQVLPDERVLLELPPPTESVFDEAVLFGGGPNWSHGVLDWGSRLLTMSVEPSLQSLPVLIAHNIPRSIRELYQLMGLAPERCVSVDPQRPPAVKKLWLPALTHPYQLMSPHYVSYFRRTLAAHLNVGPSRRRLYLSRKKAGYRFIVNESELLTQLARLGFETVIPEDLTMSAQIALLASAEMIVCPIGGGSAAAMFAPSDCIYIELCHTFCQLNQYRIVCSLLGQIYHQVVGQPTINRGPSLFDYDFRVPVEQIVKIVTGAPTGS